MVSIYININICGASSTMQFLEETLINLQSFLYCLHQQPGLISSVFLRSDEYNKDGNMYYQMQKISILIMLIL